MKNFSIGELEHISGIKAHTLRTWELRYQIPNPKRLQTKVRTYSLEELKTVMDMAVLNRNGFRISRLSSLTPKQIEQQLQWLILDEDQQTILTNRLIISMYRMDVEAFESDLKLGFSLWPAPVVMRTIVLPFLKKTNLLSKGQQITEEHLVVVNIRKKIIWAIEQMTTGQSFSDAVVLFLTGTKELDLGLLYVYFQLLLAGRKVVYLGNDVTSQNLKEVVQKYKPRLLYTYRSKIPASDLLELAAYLQDFHPQSRLVCSLPHNSSALSHPHLYALDYEEALRFLLDTPVTPELRVAGLR